MATLPVLLLVVVVPLMMLRMLETLLAVDMTEAFLVWAVFARVDAEEAGIGTP